MLEASPSDAPAAVPRSSTARELFDLLASMRFSISLLTVICIASVIGTVVKQREPLNNYVNQFGPFWAEFYQRIDLYTVYSAWWFLLILAFLVLSTSLCIARNTPKILVDLKSYKEDLREQSLKSFHHRAQGQLGLSPVQTLERINAILAKAGWQAKLQQRDGGQMVAARAGTTNKIGYIAAHSAIVLVCLGGLLDGDLIVKGMMLLQGKSAYSGAGLIRDVPTAHRLGEATPTFRGNLMVPEGGRAGTAILNMPDGVVLQDLPFDVELKKFIVEYYDTGMPKLFASEVLIHDRDTGKTTPATVKVNEPAHHRGVAIYQSSFDDGGSEVTLQAQPLVAGGKTFKIQGTIGSSTSLSNGDDKLMLEFTGLRVINVENTIADGGSGGSGADVRKVDLAASLDKHLGSGAKVKTEKALQNVGPSISYKLRDASGQAREYNNYMVPVELDGQRSFLVGVRDTPAESFRYLRIPVDDQGNIDGWLKLRQALGNPALREQAALRYARLATPLDKPEMTPQLQGTARRALSLFAGAEGVKPGETPVGGLPGLSQFIEREVPESDRSRISEVLLRILNGSLFELHKMVREQAGLAAPGTDEAAQRFMTQSVLALSDSMFYPAPVILQLSDFKQVQASVFQVARAPGQKLVYLGAVLLIVGVFTMLYIRERRMWIWLQAVPEGTRVTMALSTTRRTLDTDTEFDRLQQAVLRDKAT